MVISATKNENVAYIFSVDIFYDVCQTCFKFPDLIPGFYDIFTVWRGIWNEVTTETLNFDVKGYKKWD